MDELNPQDPPVPQTPVIGPQPSALPAVTLPMDTPEPIRRMTADEARASAMQRLQEQGFDVPMFDDHRLNALWNATSKMEKQYQDAEFRRRPKLDAQSQMALDVMQQYEDAKTAEQARQSWLQSLDTDPDEAARSEQIAKELGVSADQVRTDPQVYQRRAQEKVASMQRLYEQAPVLARFLSDLPKAKLMSDVTDKLWWYERWSAGWSRMAVQDEIAEIRSEQLAQSWSGVTLDDERESKVRDLQAKLEKMPQVAGMWTGGAEITRQFYDQMLWPAITAVGTGLAASIVTTPAGGAATAVTVFFGGNSLQGYRQIQGHSFQNLLDVGYDPQAAADAARGVALVAAIPEALGLGKFVSPVVGRAALKTFGPKWLTRLGGSSYTKKLTSLTAGEIAKRAASYGVKTALVETGQEEVEENIQMLAEVVSKAMSRPEYQEAIAKGEEALGSYWERTFEVAAYTLQGMVIPTAGMAAFGSMGDIHRARKAVKNGRKIETLNHVSKQIDPLAARDPQLAQEVAQAVADSTEQGEILIEAGSLRQHIASMEKKAHEEGKGVQPLSAYEAFRQKFPKLAEQLDNAQDDRADIVIPIGEYVAGLGKTEFAEVLKQDLRIATKDNPNPLSLKEALDAFNAAEKMRLRAEEAEAEEEAEEGGAGGGAKKIDSVVRVRQAVTNMLRKTGRYTSAQVNMQAELWVRAVVFRASRRKMDAWEFFSKENPMVLTEEQLARQAGTPPVRPQVPGMSPKATAPRSSVTPPGPAPLAPGAAAKGTPLVTMPTAAPAAPAAPVTPAPTQAPQAPQVDPSILTGATPEQQQESTDRVEEEVSILETAAGQTPAEEIPAGTPVPSATLPSEQMQQAKAEMAQVKADLAISRTKLTTMHADGKSQTAEFKAEAENYRRLVSRMEKAERAEIDVVTQLASMPDADMTEAVFNEMAQAEIDANALEQQAQDETLSEQERAAAAQGAAQLRAYLNDAAKWLDVKEVEVIANSEAQLEGLLEKRANLREQLNNLLADKPTTTVKATGKYAEEAWTRILGLLDAWADNPDMVIQTNGISVVGAELAAQRIRESLKKGTAQVAAQDLEVIGHVAVDSTVQDDEGDARSNAEWEGGSPAEVRAAVAAARALNKQLDYIAEKVRQSLAEQGGAKAKQLLDQIAKVSDDIDKVEEPLRSLKSLRSRAPLAAEQSAEMSVRRPTGKKVTEDSLMDVLNINFQVAMAHTDTKQKHANLILSYPFVAGALSEAERADPDTVIEKFVNWMADNLKTLYHAMPKELRDRSRQWYDGARKYAVVWSERYGISEMQAAAIIAALSPQKDWFVNVSMAERMLDMWTTLRDQRVTPEMQKRAEFRNGEADTDENAEDISPAERMSPKEKKRIWAQIGNSTLGELMADPMKARAAAMFMRMWDETYNSNKVFRLTPEGGSTGVDWQVKMQWQSYGALSKVISLLRDGSRTNVWQQIGNEHKVRSFYNNIVSPNSVLGHATIDTHAVAAALFLPLSSSSDYVGHAWGGGGASKSAETGMNGLYAIFVEAYRRAGADPDINVLPREMQSITWESVRSLFTPDFKDTVGKVASAEKVIRKARKTLADWPLAVRLIPFANKISELEAELAALPKQIVKRAEGQEKRVEKLNESKSRLAQKKKDLATARKENAKPKKIESLEAAIAKAQGVVADNKADVDVLTKLQAQLENQPKLIEKAKVVLEEKQREFAAKNQLTDDEFQELVQEGLPSVLEAEKNLAQAQKKYDKNINTDLLVAMEGMWRDSAAGKLTPEQVRDRIIELAEGQTKDKTTGFRPLFWEGSAYNSDQGPTYVGLSRDLAAQVEQTRKARGVVSPPQLAVEVAPNPADAQATARWDKLPAGLRSEVSHRVLMQVLPLVLTEVGTLGQSVQTVGGFNDKVNASFRVTLSSPQQTILAGRILGELLNQQSVQVVSRDPMAGTQQANLVQIELPAGFTPGDANSIYALLRDVIRSESRESLIQGFTADGEFMDIVWSADDVARTGVTAEQLATLVGATLPNLTVGKSTVYSKRLETGTDYGLRGTSSVAAQSLPQQRAEYLVREAGAIYERELAAAESALEGNRGGWDPRGDLAPLADSPQRPGVEGPDPGIVAAAELYAARTGLVIRRQSNYVAMSEELSRRLADAYEAMSDDSKVPEVAEAYADLKRQTLAQYQALIDSGYRFWFFDAASDPYASNGFNALRDLRATRTMAVYSTQAGYGNEPITDQQRANNPMLEDTGLRWPSGSLKGEEQPVLLNDVFRAVHDAFGHAMEGSGFRMHGEENAWQSHVRFYTGPARRAITTETRGQNSLLNSGPSGQANRVASVDETKFSGQKTGLLPEWAHTTGVTPDMQSRARDRAADALFPVADASKVNANEHMVQMRIEDFLGVSNPMDGASGNEARIEELKQLLEAKGSEAAVPTLTLKTSGTESTVVGHTGKEEAVALLGLGYTHIPVVLNADFEWAQQQDKNAEGYVAEWPLVVVGEGANASTRIAFPVQRVNATQDYKAAVEPEPAPAAAPAAAPQQEMAPPTMTRGESLRQLRSVAPNRPTPGTEVRGEFFPDQMLVLLRQKADMSTFLHESSHMFMMWLMRDAALPDASEADKRDAQALLDWFGIGSLDEWNALGIEGQRKYHERFAYSWEIWFSEGVAPTEELDGVFATFRRFLLRVYDVIRTQLNETYKQEFGEDLPILTGDVQMVMSRMLAADQEIQKTESARKMQPIYMTQEQAMAAGLTPEQWNDYLETKQRARDAAAERLGQRHARIIAMLGRTAMRVLDNLQEKAAEIRAAVETEETDAVSKLPQYRLLNWIRTGVLLNDEGEDMGETGLEPGESRKLNRGEVMQILAELKIPGLIDEAAIERKLGHMLSERGQSPTLVAPMVGWSTATDMIREMVDVKPMDEVVQKRTDERMLAEYSEFYDDQDMQDAVGAALHNKHREELIAIELEHEMTLLRMEADAASETPEIRADREKNKQLAVELGEKRKELVKRIQAERKRIADATTGPAVQVAEDELTAAEQAKDIAKIRVARKKVKEAYKQQTQARNDAAKAVRKQVSEIDKKLRKIKDKASPEAQQLQADRTKLLENDLLRMLDEKRDLDNQIVEANRKATGLRTPIRTIVHAAHKAAEKMIAGRRVSEVSASKHARIAERARADAQKARQQNNIQSAVDAKTSELVHHAMVVLADKLHDTISNTKKLVRRIFAADTKLGERRMIEVVLMVRALASLYGLGPNSDAATPEVVQAAIAKVREFNPAMADEVENAVAQAAQIATERSKDAAKRDKTGPLWEDLTVDQFKDLSDIIETLWKYSLEAKRIEIENQRMQAQDVANQLAEPLQAQTRKAAQDKWKRATSDTEKRSRRLLTTWNKTKIVELWCEMLDGVDENGKPKDGPWTRLFYRPIQKAIDDWRWHSGNMKERSNAIIKKFGNLKRWKEPLVAAELGGYEFASKAELLGAILQSGNLSNLTRLLLGMRRADDKSKTWGSVNEDGTLNHDDWVAFIDRITSGDNPILTKSDFEAVQELWDLNAEILPYTQRAWRAVFGVPFKQVELEGFTNRFGEWKGGYWPAKQDATKSPEAAQRDLEATLENEARVMHVQTPRGFGISRVEHEYRPLQLDIRLSGIHLTEALQFAYIQPHIKKVLQVLKQKNLSNALESFDPTILTSLITPYLNRVSQQTQSMGVDATSTGWIARWLRRRTGINQMFSHLANALQQVTGHFVTMTRVPVKYWARAFVQWWGGAAGDMAKDQEAMSKFMFERRRNKLMELAGNLDEMLNDPNAFEKFREKVEKQAYWLQSLFQNQVDSIAWTAAFNHRMDQLRADTTMQQHEKVANAVAHADGIVRKTQGSLNPESISAMHNASEWSKLVFQFQSYFITLMHGNLSLLKSIKRDIGWKHGNIRMLHVYVMGFLLPMVIGDAISKAATGDWEDDEDGDGIDDVWFEVFVGSQVRGLTAMAPVVGPVATTMANAFDDKPYNDRLLNVPALSAIEKSAKGANDLYEVFYEGRDVRGRDAKEWSWLFSMFTGLPTLWLAKPAEQLIDWNAGQSGPANGADAVRALVFGGAWGGR